MEYFDGIDFPEGHQTYCHCDQCDAVEHAIVMHYRRVRAARLARIGIGEAEEIEQAQILDYIERNG